MRTGLLESLSSAMLLIFIAIGVVVAFLSLAYFILPEQAVQSGSEPHISTQASPSPTATPAPHIGIIAGHWKSDSGALCPDGLQEVQITLAVAKKTVTLLQEAGYRVDLLPEKGPELENYHAHTLVSIHADSCIYSSSGFKVARWDFSLIPDIEDQLVKCLYAEYQAATGLRRDDRTITRDMTQYHAFRRKATETPGAIIELGFMGSNRSILMNRQDEMAAGVAAGVRCFLESTWPTATPSLATPTPTRILESSGQ